MPDQPDVGTGEVAYATTKPYRRDTYPYQPTGKVAATVFGCVPTPPRSEITIKVDPKIIEQAAKLVKHKPRK